MKFTDKLGDVHEYEIVDYFLRNKLYIDGVQIGNDSYAIKHQKKGIFAFYNPYVQFAKEIILMNYDGTIISKKKFDYVESANANNEYIIVRYNHKMHLMDLYGNIVKKINHDKIICLSNGYFLAFTENLYNNNRKYTLYSPYAKKMLTETYKYLEMVTEHLFIVKQKDSFFLVNHWLEMVSEETHDEIYKQHDHDILVFKDNSKYGVMDLSGKVIVPAKYTTVESNDYYIKVQKNGKYGIYSIDGKKHVECRYDSFQRESYGYILAQKDDKITVICEEDFEPKLCCDYVSFSTEYGLIVSKKAIQKYYSKDGNLILDNCKSIECIEHCITSMKYLIAIGKDGLCGLYDIYGKAILDCEYEDISFIGYEDNAFLVFKDDKYSLRSLDGKPLTEVWYDDLIKLKKEYNLYDYCDHTGDYKILTISQKSAIADKDCNLLTEFKYDYVGSLCEDIIIVGISSSSSNSEYIYGYFDVKEGKEITEIIYDNADEFYKGFASASINEKWGVINKQGETVIPFDYDYVELS